MRREWLRLTVMVVGMACASPTGPRAVAPTLSAATDETTRAAQYGRCLSDALSASMRGGRFDVARYAMLQGLCIRQWVGWPASGGTQL